MSPYLPVTAEEIAGAAIGAAEAGASIIHLHARDPKNGKPDQTPEAFEPFLKIIKQRSNCVVNLTTGGKSVHDGRGTIEARGDVPAGSRIAQHGVDEFRPVSDATAL
jgi:uncharacterized protein (DUF849 family)